MFSGHYDDWIASRMNGIKKYMSNYDFKNKTLLELGCGYGHNGNEFSKLGAIVTSSDAREEHIVNGKNLYPHISFILSDSDKLQIDKKYDIILHWGLLYHLSEIENHLNIVCKNCDILLLETEVCDSDNENFCLFTNEEGYDQAFNNIGIRPSQQYVEKILRNNGFEYQMIIDSIINSGFHNYDWTITNTNTWRHGLRRFWICKKIT